MTGIASAPNRKRLIWAAVGGLAVLVLAAVGAGVGYLVGGDEQATPPPAAADVAAFGQMELARGGFTWNRDPAQCWGRDGYDDIQAGAAVTVTDPDGKVVALGKLEPGKPTVVEDRAMSCLFRFEVQVPAGLKFYGIEVSHRGVVQFNQEDLTGKGVTLTLG